jgi:hypothetical protein
VENRATKRFIVILAVIAVVVPALNLFAPEESFFNV